MTLFTVQRMQKLTLRLWQQWPCEGCLKNRPSSVDFAGFCRQVDCFAGLGSVHFFCCVVHNRKKKKSYQIRLIALHNSSTSFSCVHQIYTHTHTDKLLKWMVHNNRAVRGTLLVDFFPPWQLEVCHSAIHCARDLKNSSYEGCCCCSPLFTHSLLFY